MLEQQACERTAALTAANAALRESRAEIERQARVFNTALSTISDLLTFLTGRVALSLPINRYSICGA